MTLQEQKKKLRKKLSLEKSKYSQNEKRSFSKTIWKRLEQMSAFQKSNIILLYHSLPDEVHTHDFIEKWSDRKQILLPVVVKESLLLRKYNKENLNFGMFGIQEPRGDNFTELDQIDLTIVPALAYDKQGRRLGRGGGYYDRLLPQLQGIKIGVCFPFQVIEKVPTEDFDYFVDFIIFD